MDGGSTRGAREGHLRPFIHFHHGAVREPQHRSGSGRGPHGLPFAELLARKDGSIVPVSHLIENAVYRLHGGAHSGRRNQAAYDAPSAETDSYGESGSDGPFRGHGKGAHYDFGTRQGANFSGTGGLQSVPAIDALM